MLWFVNKRPGPPGGAGHVFCPLGQGWAGSEKERLEKKRNFFSGLDANDQNRFDFQKKWLSPLIRK